MEFERAIYRVYEKCIEGLREDDPDSISPRSCKLMETMVLCIASFLLLSLCILHITFVGSAGCLPNLLAMQPNPLHSEVYTNGSLSPVTLTNFTALDLRQDQILQIDVRGSFVSSFRGNEDLSGDQDEEVSILRWDRVSSILSNLVTATKAGKLSAKESFSPTSLFNKFITETPFYNGTDTPLFPSSPNEPKNGSPRRFRRAHGFDYEFAFNIAVLALPEEVRYNHHFHSFNLTLSGEECFGSPFTMALLPLGGVDTVVKNYLQNTFHKEGAMIAATGDYYTWSREDANLANLSFAQKFSFKCFVLVMSCLSFFFVSTVTALLVRILISSGVVLLFPIFWMIQVRSHRLAASLSLTIIS
jgi:hypothetical protein